MVTIQNLEVRFDVDGESDEAVFARLFVRHIGSWHREQCARQAQERAAHAERALGDRDEDAQAQ